MQNQNMQTEITLRDGNRIPQLGAGTYMIENHQLCKATVRDALDLGYRHIDTAQIYKNERAVGEALAESGVDRKDVFLTTKVWVTNFTYEKASRSIDASLARLGTDYIDLLLVHRPYGNYWPAWQAMEDAMEAGKIRSIGLSNFSMDQTRQILDRGRIYPVVNQIECHPFYQQRELRRELESLGIRVEAWYPLGHGSRRMMQEPVLAELSRIYGKSVAQIILRWHIQEDCIVLPKSTRRSHLAENVRIFDFQLTPEDMERIRALDRNETLFKCPLWLDEWKARLFTRA